MQVPDIHEVLALPRRAVASAASVPGAAIDGVSAALTSRRPLEEEEHRNLRLLASGTSTGRWHLASARNAHSTNTPSEMERALRGDYDVLEGDLRLDRRGRLVMAHDPLQLDGMTFHQWLEIGAHSGRGLKVDVKDPAAIGPMLRMLARSGVPDNRLILNVPLGTDGAKSASVGHLRLLRRHAPGATINLSNQRYPYDHSQLEQLRAAADFVGGRVMFPLRSDQVSPTLARSLRPHGAVAAWNLPLIDSPAQVAAEHRRLRRLGVNGTIDLRRGREVPLAREVLALHATAERLRGRVRDWLA